MFHTLSPASNLGTVLASFVEEVMGCNHIIQDQNAKKSEFFKSAKACGIDVKAMKETIKRLSRTPEEQEELARREQIITEYLESLGISADSIRAQGLSPDAVIGGRDDFPADLSHDLSAAI